MAEVTHLMTPEKKVQNPVIAYAEHLGCKVIRFYFGRGATTGWPDVLFLIPGGRPLFIEFKAPGNEPTKKQARKIEILRELGYAACWTDSVEEGKIMIDEAMEAAA